jgi:hypothetical protein
MSFPWMEPDLPASFVQRGKARLERDELAEAEYRARLYLSLGYSLEEAKKRVAQNLRWEWELHKAPGHHKKAAGAVEGHYARVGASKPAASKSASKKR